MKSITKSLVALFTLFAVGLFSPAASAQEVAPPSFGDDSPVSKFILVEVYACPKIGASPNAVGQYNTPLLGTLLAHDGIKQVVQTWDGQAAIAVKDQVSALIQELRARGGPFAEPETSKIRILYANATKEGKKCPSLELGEGVES